VAYLNRAVRNAKAMMRAQDWGSESVIPPNSQIFPTTKTGIEQAALGISTTLACVKALYDDVSTMPFAAYTGDQFGAREPLAVQPLVVTEPFGPDLDVASGFGQMVVSRAMRGNIYAFVTHRDPVSALADQFAILHPDSVKPFRKKGVKRFRIGQEEYGTDEILHLTGFMLPGSVEGVDVLTAQRVNFNLAQSVASYAEGFFGSGGSPSGVISVPGEGNRRKAREVRDAWEAGHGGVGNAHRPAVVFGGATWEQLSVTPENAQFLATRGFLREEICGLFSVPLQRIQAIVENASQGGGKGLDAIDAQYVKHGLMPILTCIETAWNQLIPGGQRSWTRFDIDVFLRASAAERASIGQQHRVGGIRTIDEIRAPEGWAPLPDGLGTDPFTPLNSNTTSPTGGVDNAPNPGGTAS
jgi:HK97 family phage portal protein